MKKKLTIAFSAVICLVLLTLIMPGISVSADNITTVYVDQINGRDSDSGKTKSNPKRTINGAIEAIPPDGGRIVFVSDYTLNGGFDESAHEGVITFSSVNGKSLLLSGSSVYRMNGPDVFDEVGITCSGNAVIAAQFHDLHMTERVKITNGLKYLFLVGGYEAPSSPQLSKGKDSRLIIDGGGYHYICGFTRTKGAATMYFTGTSNITVNGGIIDTVYGGTLYNHAGGSTVITVNGGEIRNVFTAGDVTRKLTGTADLILNGGSIGNLFVNNVIGDAAVDFRGTSFGSVAVVYENDTLAGEAKTSVKKATYNVLKYSQADIVKIEKAFDVAENTTSVVVGQDGVGTIEEALSLLEVSGGTIILREDYVIGADVSLPSTSKEVVITSENNAVLTFNGETVSFLSPAKFEDITIKASVPLHISADDRLSFGTGVVALGDVSVSAANVLSIGSGEYSVVRSRGDGAFISLSDGKISGLIVSGSSSAEIIGGSCEKIEASGSAIVQLFDGAVGCLSVDGATGFFINRVRIDRVAFTDSGKNGRRLVYGSDVSDETKALLNVGFDDISSMNIVYVENGGTGDGSSPGSPFGDLSKAVQSLGSDGNVVICGDYSHNYQKLASYSYAVTITGRDAFFDREGTILFNANMLIGGATAFDDLKFIVNNVGLSVYAMGYPLVIGETVESIAKNDNDEFLSISAGRNDGKAAENAVLTINGGHWNRLIGGSVNSGAVAVRGGKSDITINGGVFDGYVSLAGSGFTSAESHITVNGGTFYGGIYGLYSQTAPGYGLNHVISVTINGGTVYFQIAPSPARLTKYQGSFDVTLNGGDFSHLTDVLGCEKYPGGGKSKLTVSDTVVISEAETGEITFTNPLRAGADPWVFTCGGYYYYAATGGILHKVTNISDLSHSKGYKIFNPAPGHEYSHKMWSPEIHYFSEAEVGSENAGWYLFICCDDGSVETAEKLKAFVLKCLDGDDLLGRWGNPVTGEVNVPVKMYNKDDASVNSGDKLFGGMSVIRIEGVPYIMFISEEGRGTADFYQTINITEMDTPWIMRGKSGVICTPEYPWEKGGYGKSSTEEKWWPMVVEGSTAVYGDNGEVFIIYSGSGYWTTSYCLAQMTYLGGDPLMKSSWAKDELPFFSLSAAINGCGHASYYRDVDGNRWLCYHAYIGKDTSSGRFAFAEPYSIVNGKMVVGNGSGHPNEPETVYTISINPMPLGMKLTGFTESNVSLDPDESGESSDTLNTGETESLNTNDGIRRKNADIIVIVISISAIVAAFIAVGVAAVLFKKNKS